MPDAVIMAPAVGPQLHAGFAHLGGVAEVHVKSKMPLCIELGLACGEDLSSARRITGRIGDFLDCHRRDLIGVNWHNRVYPTPHSGGGSALIECPILHCVP